MLLNEFDICLLLVIRLLLWYYFILVLFVLEIWYFNIIGCFLRIFILVNGLVIFGIELIGFVFVIL